MLCHRWLHCRQAQPSHDRAGAASCAAHMTATAMPVALQLYPHVCWQRVWPKSVPQQVALDAKGLPQEFALVCEQGEWQPLCLQSGTIL